MGKKSQYIIPILLALASALNPVSVHAETVQNGVTYWTISEMMEFKETIDKEIQDICGDDYHCEDDTRYEYYRRGGKYRALEVADMVGGFMVTNINPALEKITIRYTSLEDIWFRHSGIEPIHEDIISLYMVWIDEGVGDPFVDTRFMYNYAERLEAGEDIPGVHVVLAKNNSKDGTGWLEEGKETEFSIAGSDIVNMNPSGRIYHKLGGNIGMSISIGTTFLSECLDSPDYELGMDCRLVIGDDGSYSYIPMKVATSAPTPKDPDNLQRIDDQIMQDILNDLYGEDPEPDMPTPESEPEPTEKPEELTTEPTDEPELNLEPTPEPELILIPEPIISEPAPVQIQGKLPTLTTSITVTAPDTGASTDDKNRALEMPWWIAALIISGGILLVWWFMPTRLTKFQKKSKKSVDKSKPV